MKDYETSFILVTICVLGIIVLMGVAFITNEVKIENENIGCSCKK